MSNDNNESGGTTRAPKVPIARVKRIIKQDDDVVGVSNSAVYSIAAATELFAQYFTEQALLSAQGDRRKKLQYGDFASAVSNTEQLEFLSDLVPKKVPYKKVIEHKQAKEQGIRKYFTGQQEVEDDGDEYNNNTITENENRSNTHEVIDIDDDEDMDEDNNEGNNSNEIEILE